MFQFTVDGYDRLPQLRYRWTTPPDPISAAYIGLADFTNDRWDWWQCDEHGWFSFGDIAPYTRPADDAMIAAVVVAGATGTASLRYLRLGHPGVEAVLTSIPPTGIAPLSVTLNGGGTTTFLGSVTDYHWNFDGDGTIDLSGTDLTAEHTYSQPGTYSPRLTVETGHAEEDSASTTVTAYAPWTHTWGGGEDEQFYAVDSDDTGIYAAGTTRSFSGGGTDAVLLVKYALDGTFEWARTWQGLADDRASGIAVSSLSLIHI